MLTKIFEFTFQRVRPEFYYSAYVVISAIVYSMMYVLLDILFSILGWHYSIDWNMVGIFIGCIGFGELVRTLSKLYFPRILSVSSMLTSFYAGAGAISSFVTLIALEWGHSIWIVLASIPLGGLFYIVLILSLIHI